MSDTQHRISRAKSKRLYQVVARRIAQMIEANPAPPGWLLPSERELAETLDVSRAVVREAVIALEMRGVVEVRGREGIFVLPATGNQLGFDALNTDIGAGPFELLEARLAVEGGAAAQAAPRVTSYDILELKETIERMDQASGSSLLDDTADRDFHLAIANISGNAILFSIVEALWAQRESSPMWRRVLGQIDGDMVRPLWIGDHHAIVAALRLRNPEAARRAMEHHINHVIDELLKADEAGQFGESIGARQC